MRNLEQFPVTPEEVIERIDGILHEMKAGGRFGDISPMIMEAVRRYLIDNPRAVASIVESLRA